MKPSWWRTGLMLGGGMLWLAGCVVQSLNPFYTAENRIDLPAELVGNWVLISESGQARTGYRPWSFTGKTLTISDEYGQVAELEAVFFKVGERLYLDTIADAPDPKELNRFWTTHLTPVHLLCRVEVTDDTLTLLPLNFEWLNRQIKTAGGPSAVVREGDEQGRLFTAPAAEWETFLAANDAQAEAFPVKLAMVLKRTAEPPAPVAAAPAVTPGVELPAAK